MSRASQAPPGFIAHPLLAALGVEHGFGTREAQAPEGLRRPHQVHGPVVVRAGEIDPHAPGDADAVVSDDPALPAGVITADCVPILVASASGAVVVAIHAGWRGLAQGVVAAGVRALMDVSGSESGSVAVVGPAIGRCCYEVDAPVMDPLRERFGSALSEAALISRPGHHRLDLGQLVRVDLVRSGISPERVGLLERGCTACDPERFHSYRRDGALAGRLVHYARPRAGLGG
ncbi:MAG: polyphenol oxidase family protein [Myxococcota bacterium]|jgi:polyphenol oxidase|nr:polyphenol oxidase family protein [Myxococcota bacterium]